MPEKDEMITCNYVMQLHECSHARPTSRTIRGNGLGQSRECATKHMACVNRHEPIRYASDGMM